MHVRLTSIICSGLLAAVISITAAGAQSDKESAPERFAFADATGTHLLLQTERTEATQFLTKAVCQEGRALPVTAVNMTEIPHEHEANNSSEQKNFHGLWGVVYHVAEPGAASSDMCLLLDYEAFEASTILPPLDIEAADCRKSTSDLVEADRMRTISDCAVLAEFENGAQVSLIRFEPDGDDLLASIVLAIEDGYAAHLMPAKAGNSAWRVDDGGAISQDEFAVLFALQSADGISIAIAWAGAEGMNLGLYEARDKTMEIVAEGYRYFMFPDSQ